MKEARREKQLILAQIKEEEELEKEQKAIESKNDRERKQAFKLE